jgi:hypothetical protein
MRKLILIVPLLAGCITWESRRAANHCINERAIATTDALQEIARISEATPLPPAVVEPIQRAYEASSGIPAWAALVEKDIGRASAPPKIMTNAETARQGVYQTQIDIRNAIEDQIPLKMPGSEGSGLPWGDFAGKGATGVGGVILSLLLAKSKRAESAAKRAVKKGLKLIGQSNDPEIKKQAANDPDLVREYAKDKASKYDMRVEQLREKA